MEAAPKEETVKSNFTDYDYSHFYHGSGDDPLNVLPPFMKWLNEAFPAGYYIYSEPMTTAPGIRVKVRSNKTGELREMLNLASYNYLGISYREEVKEAAIEAVRKYGLGASGSPILSGTFDVHEQLAEELAQFKGKEACILFPTGYSANVGFISALMRSGDSIIVDQFAHASVVDGAILAKSKTIFFRHNNPLDLERKLKGLKGKKLVVVEGVYSMDGDVCALPEILEVCKRHGARMLIDEAHSTFLFGPNGRGVAEHFGLDKEVDFHLGTFSKSLGGQGGFVCGGRDLITYVSGFARSRFFSCNLAPAIAAGLLAGLRIVRSEPQLRAKLWSNVAYLRRRFAEEGVDIGKSNSQVMPVLINNDAKVIAVAAKIQERGIYLQPVTYPAVPKHKSRLRVSISAAHAESDLEEAVQVIAAVLREEGICS
jgi:8-amino-7-oxononanoate synthase